jgi:LmbE family N-acetylglucosaminyl deacetylase
MPSETQSALLFLAHQDDEFGAQKLIDDAVALGIMVSGVYMTQAKDPQVNALRNHESLKVVLRLGVCAENISFAGEELNILDGQLQWHLAAVADWVHEAMVKHDPLHIWIPAWEGGHPDHDALHAVVVELAAVRGLLGRVQQFPLYNGWRCRGPLFRVMQVLPDNGVVYNVPLPWSARWRYLRNCLAYPSQWRTWMGLFPFVLARILFKGVQQVQEVSRERLIERPHEGRLYYESRGFSTWDNLQMNVSRWMNCLG